MQTAIFKKAEAFKADNTYTVDTYDEFKKILETKPGFIYAHWDGTSETEEKIKAETKATIRCIPLNSAAESGKCIYSGQPSTQRVLFAKAY
jgi:prolyl-tRNA synthetase